MKKIWFFIFFLIVVTLTMFIAENSEIVSIRFLDWDIEFHIVVIIIISVGIGGVFGLLSEVPSYLSRKREISILRKEKEIVERELSLLKAQLQRGDNSQEDNLFTKPLTI